MGHIAYHRVVWSFIKPSPAGLEQCGYKRYIALCLYSTANKCLSARICKRNRKNTQRVPNYFTCGLQFVPHSVKREVLQLISHGPSAITFAGMRKGQVANFETC